MEELDLQALVQRIVVWEDQQAFRRLFAHFYDRLLFFAKSFVKSREQAEEIVQDVFVALWKKRDTLSSVVNLKVYLYVAVKNLSINYLNRSGSHYTDDLNHLDVSYTGGTATPEELLVASEIRQAIVKAVSELPPRCRLVYKLVKEDGLQYREVARILHISPRTVENQVAAALRKIALDIHIDFGTLVSRPSGLRRTK